MPISRFGNKMDTSHRNLQKRVKEARYEQEKVYMARMQGMGCAVGEYVRNGQGDSESTTEAPTSADLDPIMCS